MFYPIFYKLCAKNHLDVPRKQTHIRFFEILVNHCYKVTRFFKFSVSFRVRYGIILTRLRMLLLLYMFTCFTWTHLNTHSLGRYTQKYWITCIMPLKDCCTYTGTAVPPPKILSTGTYCMRQDRRMFDNYFGVHDYIVLYLPVINIPFQKEVRQLFLRLCIILPDLNIFHVNIQCVANSHTIFFK